MRAIFFKNPMMKNFYIISIFILAVTGIKAQFSITDYDGNSILDGEVRTYNMVSYPEAYLGFYVHNDNDTDPIKVRILVESITNGTGSGMELCFGICYFTITEGESYPVNDVVTIQPGETQPSAGDHFFNSDDSNSPITYVFKFYEVDDNMNEIGDSITFTYVYDETMDVEDIQSESLNLTLSPNPAKDILNIRIDSDEFQQLSIQDVSGKLVVNKAIQFSGNQYNLDIRDLEKGVYFLTLTNGDRTLQEKFIKR